MAIDEKLTAQTEETSPAITDMVYVVKDPTGTPLSRKTQIANLIKNIVSLAGFSFFLDEDDMAADSATKVASQQSVKKYVDDNAGGSTDMPSGFLINGKLVVSVATDDLTVAVKNLAGNDPSAGDPVYIRIGEVEHTLTAALSVTALDATNWCNAGSSKLATQLINYFVYLGYNSTDGVTIGFSRVPYGVAYGDFSTTSTDEDYCKISDISNAAAADAYENAGRFSATLSAGAGYTWTISGTGNVVSHPILETEILTWAPAYSASSSMTFTSVSTSHAEYQVIGRNVYYQIQGAGTIGGSADNTVFATLPFNGRNRATQVAQTAWVVADGSAEVSFAYLDQATASTLAFRRTASANWATGASKYINGAGLYAIE